MARIIAHPLAVDAAGRLATVEAGSQQHAEQAVAIIAATRLTERTVKTEFGMVDQVGNREYDVEALKSAVSRWAPFAEVVDVRQGFDTTDPLALDVTVRVRKAGR